VLPEDADVEEGAAADEDEEDGAGAGAAEEELLGAGAASEELVGAGAAEEDAEEGSTGDGATFCGALELADATDELLLEGTGAVLDALGADEEPDLGLQRLLRERFFFLCSTVVAFINGSTAARGWCCATAL